MEPRKLTVLRIDDNLPPITEIDPTIALQDRPPESIQLFTSGKFSGVTSWRTALQWWARYHGDPIPDLIVADVHFEFDQDSPLSQALTGVDNRLPTGLSHLKPFATLARAAGVVLGVSIHTAEWQLWKDMVESSEPRLQCMGYLAAHEIGELAAILGDIPLVKSVIKDQQNGMLREEQLASLWGWLENNTRRDFYLALRVAVQNYRRRLLDLTDLSGRPEVFVMPDDLASLMSWCAQMEDEPHPLDAVHDFGITLTYRDGRGDCISLASLFADVPKIMDREMPSSCFKITPSISSNNKTVEEIREAAFKLDFQQQPRIGLFISCLGTLDQAYSAATKAVEEFPKLPDESPAAQRTLRALIPDKADRVVRGLVVAFQLLHIEKYKYDVWKELFQNYRWDPRKIEFGSGRAPSRSLRHALQALVKLIEGLPKARQEPFGIEEVFTREVYDKQRGFSERVQWVVHVTDNDFDKEWMKWHFSRLVEAGGLTIVGPDEYLLLRTYREFPTPPVPSPVPTSADSSEVFEKHNIEWLKQSLGFEGNDNGIGQTLHDAFVQRGARSATEKAMSGRKFYKDMLSGTGPTWLMRLCRLYASDKLGWRDQNTWPSWLHAQK